MLTVKGYAAPAAKQKLVPFSFTRRAPGKNDVTIDILFCGICHSDIHKVRNEWGEGVFPMVPGHEIVGIVSAVGTKVERFKVGDPVGVGCFIDSCGLCENCLEDLEPYCTSGATLTYGSPTHDGRGITQGGYSTCIVVKEDFVVHIPQGLALAKAAPLLCAGITVYSPLKHWKAGPNKKIAIIGLCGLGHLGVKIAHALGAEVTILSHTLDKQEDALRLGASYFYDTSDPHAFATLKSRFDLIINTVSAPIDWNQYLALLKRDGTMVVVGIPEEAIPVHAFSLISARRSLSGSLVGGIKETQEMLDFCSQHNITAEIEVIPIQNVNKAFERMLKSDVHYRFVIDMESLKNDG